MEDRKRAKKLTWTWPWQIGKATEVERVTSEIEVIQEASEAVERQDAVAEELDHELAVLKENRITNHYAAAVIESWQPNTQVRGATS